MTGCDNSPTTRAVERDLAALCFDNRFVRALPGDPLLTNERRQVCGVAFSRVTPQPVRRPRLLAYAPEVAQLLGLSSEACEGELFAEVFAGNRVLPGMDPYAACYGGHQFGHWAGQLGDGRAITLGEVVGPAGRWELQLKGAGPTPYSRMGDGRAVLRSSIREFLCSEAMHFLGVPTTRALSLVHTGEPVVRDMFYDGCSREEPGAVVCRVAPSFVRFGSFEILAARNAPEALRKLADYVIETYQPALAGYTGAERYVRWFEHVCQLTAELVVHWMRVGFVHGVMNTDNMSVLGLTLDYGPYGFVDAYDPDWTPNTTDAAGRRYRYEQQPAVALWNLSCLAHALMPLIERAAPLEAALTACADNLQILLDRMLCQKLGFADATTDALAVARGLPEVLSTCRLDMTLFFQALIDMPAAERNCVQLANQVAPLSYASPGLSASQTASLARWFDQFQQARACAAVPDVRRCEQMRKTNPRFVLRNYMAQMAIERAEAGDLSTLRELHQLIRNPYVQQPEHAHWAAKRPDWAAHKPGCSMLSCSS